MNFFDDAKQYIAGGVNSPVRSFNGVGGEPVFFRRGRGSRVWTADGRELIDYVGSWGPMILGHAHPAVVRAVQETAANGLSFGAPSVLETELAKKIVGFMPSLELLRMVSSGTEATMSAIRLARGYTGRDTIVKFEGCYHGHSDSLLIKAGSGALTLGVPSSPGVPEALAAHTVTLNFNDTDGVAEFFRTHGASVACVIVEPVAGNMNFIAPANGFLESLRSECTRHGAVLIFDEVMTGFRVARGGAQSLFGITPDLTTLGKVIGGGMPVAAFGGRADIMSQIAPLGPVYQAGTLSGNPVAMAAGIATLGALDEDGFYERLENTATELTRGLRDAAVANGLHLATGALGGMFGFAFSKRESLRNYGDVLEADTGLFKKFFHAMLERGFYFAPSAFEAGFVSSAHSAGDIAETIAAASDAMKEITGA